MTRDLVMRHDMKSMCNKAKILIDKLDFMKVLKNCAAKYKYQQSKKVTHRMGENIYKSYMG